MDEMIPIHPGDMQTMATPTDFIGLNYYTRAILRNEKAPDNLPVTVSPAPQAKWTEMPWEVYPEGLHACLSRVHFTYQPRKIYITENGASYGDGPAGDGRVRDDRRISYLRQHFAATNQAIQDGAPIAGYFIWSLLDNFEWARGYNQRFGLVWVDYRTQHRALKDSARWYREVILSNQVSHTE
jgi:beta-glucosidase